MIDQRSVLADYLDQRVIATGVFDKMGNHKRMSGGWIRWALLQDVYVEVDGKMLDIGHIRVQHAAPLDKHYLLTGDKVKFIGRVTPYQRKSTGMQSYSLSYPDNIEIIERAPRPQAEPSRPVFEVDPIQPAVGPSQSALPDYELLLRVKESAHQVGGLERLLMLAETLRRQEV